MNLINIIDKVERWIENQYQGNLSPRIELTPEIKLTVKK